MLSNKHFIFILFASLAPSALFAIDPYDAIHDLMPQDNFPRILNSEDIPNFRPLDPQPFFTPEGDFNKDGIMDIAVSGTYTLRDQGKNPYFLLVATKKEGGVIEKLFFETYPKPVFLHKAGSTGKADPGTQAFSISFCMNCEDGLDFTWDRKANIFRRTPWMARIKQESRKVEVPAEDVPPDVVDKALQVAGKLKDVVAYTERLNKEGRKIGVRVNRHANGHEVEIYEKTDTGEKNYDTILVDVEKMRVISRKRR